MASRFAGRIDRAQEGLFADDDAVVVKLDPEHVSLLDAKGVDGEAQKRTAVVDLLHAVLPDFSSPRRRASSSERADMFHDPVLEVGDVFARISKQRDNAAGRRP